MNAPTTYLEPAKIHQAEKLPHGTCADCKSVLNIGVFFDGTDNNRKDNIGGWGHTNIARLYDAYKDDPDAGYFRHYVEGVGTKFHSIDEEKADFFGGPFGGGGEQRMVYALLQVLNSVHSFVNNRRPMFGKAKMQALLSECWVTQPTSDQYPYQMTPTEQILSDLDLRSGLVSNWGTRANFLKESASSLAKQLALKKTTPNLSGIYLDVFGFSRGAAQARVFCTWLHENLLIGGKLCGVPAYVRMLGLFDTVASVGLSSTGHLSWATAKNLRIHPDVKNCLHYIGLHEFRNSFPLDSVCVDGILPPNCCEQLGLGCHSDVGGGYQPGEQGKGIQLQQDPINPSNFVVVKKELKNNQVKKEESGKAKNKMQEDKGDSDKLSQLPLNLMLEAARSTRKDHGEDGDPWLDFKSQEAEDRDLALQFSLDPKTRAAAELYLKKCNIAPGLAVDEALKEHHALYLAFRLAVTKMKDGFQGLPSYKYATVVDDVGIEYYLAGNIFFVNQLASVKEIVGRFGTGSDQAIAQTRFHSKAGVIYRKINSMTVQPEAAVFFDRYVHDSYAGFIGKFGSGFWDGKTHGIAEPRQYLCYRYMYEGDDERLNALLQQAESDQSVA